MDYLFLNKLLLLTQTNTPVIKQIAFLIGKFIELIYYLGINNIGLCIIILTFIIYLLMIPFIYKQQKFSKLSVVMNPELKAIQKKYSNINKTKESISAMQEEQKAVYEKYGTSATGGCLNVFITMPLLFAFYRVIYNIPAYISPIKNIYLKSGVVDLIMNSSSKIQTQFINIVDKSLINNIIVEKEKITQNHIIDILWKFNCENWNKLSKLFPDSTQNIINLAENIKEYTTFLCYNISDTPLFMMQNGFIENNYLNIIFALLIPFISGVTQFINIKLTQNMSSINKTSMFSSMKIMNLIMTVFSIYICFTLPIGLGIYWIFAAVFRSIEQYFINKYLDKIGIDEIIKSNKKKQEQEIKKYKKNYHLKEKALYCSSNVNKKNNVDIK